MEMEKSQNQGQTEVNISPDPLGSRAPDFLSAMRLAHPITTKVTRLLKCRTPIICPPMAGATGGALAAQVSMAGGFGLLASGYESLDVFKKELSLAEKMLGTPVDEPLPIGVGFLGWKLDESEASQKAFDIALARKVRAVWLSFGANLGKWVNKIREDGKVAGHTPVVLVVVSTVEEAVKAVSGLKPDILVAQGIESGGHGFSGSPPLLTLVSTIRASLPDVTLLVAGGLSSGSQLAAFLALGASGAVYGTRFLLSEESLYNDAQKSLLKDADSISSTTRSYAFDEVRGTIGWPSGVDGRGLINKTVTDAGDLSLENRKQKYLEGTRRGDRNHLLAWAGTGIHLMNDLLPAKNVVDNLHEQAVSSIQAVSGLLSTPPSG